MVSYQIVNARFGKARLIVILLGSTPAVGHSHLTIF